MNQEDIGYLLGRHEQEMSAATAASNKAARVADYELAYRYSVAIAQTSGASYAISESVSSVFSLELEAPGVTAATAASDKHPLQTELVSQ
jgi:outer membrane lipopolysaccharide assembly protein LptE/RlpB